eukprot:gene29685-35831_t
MRMLLSAVFIVLVGVVKANLRPREYYEQKFFDWLVQHKVPIDEGRNFVHYLQNFANNDDKITLHNEGNSSSYTLGHNKFSHLSYEEWRTVVGFGLRPKPTHIPSSLVHRGPEDSSSLPDEVDWTQKGAVTDVKDQGSCGSCWAFSATGALEGAYFVANGKLESFSEQNLVDCDNEEHGGTDAGCNGGMMDDAFAWVQMNRGICTEDSYPYIAHEHECAQEKCKKVEKAAPKEIVDVDASDAALMSAIQQQPVSVAIEADQFAFQLYKSGVFTGRCGSNLDHGVLAVGYGTLKGKDYYKVKNSWGEEWGMAGYILLERGGKQKGGQCGILTGPPSYPILK